MTRTKMNRINYLLEGFGFRDMADFRFSTFGFMGSNALMNWAAIAAAFATFTHAFFGFSTSFLIAYVVLILFEWITGVTASLKRGEKHESRKLGRMFLKIIVYSLLIYIPNTFSKEAQFPEAFGYEVDPFLWLYWVILFVIIWQLVVSILENLDSLKFKFAGVLLKIINRKFYKNFDLEDESRKST